MILSPDQYASLLKRMSSEHGIAATLGRRSGMEQEYYLHHKARGVKQRGKYRL